MKKLNVFIILVVILSILLIGCSDKYEEWKTVSILGGGTIKVPQDWVVTQEDNVMYITDKPINEEGYKIYLVGTVFDDKNSNNYLLPYKLFENVELIGEVNTVNYSNSGMYGIEEYDISGNIETRYIIHLYHTTNTSNFIAWDNLLDEDMIIKITKSYVPSVDADK